MSAVQNEEFTQEQVDQLVDLIEKLKVAGNKALTAGAHKDAIKLYSDGINTAIQIKDHVPDKLLSQLFSNRAAVKLSMGQFAEAVDDSRKAVDVDKLNLKGFYRAAKASMNLELYQQSCEFCEAGLAVDPSHQDLKDLLTVCRERLSTYKEAKAVESRGFTEEDAINCENQLKQVDEQYYLLKQKIHSREFEISRNDRTTHALSEMGDISCFKSMGRSFVRDEKADILVDLKDRNVSYREELAELQKTLIVLEERKSGLEKELREIASYFSRRQQNS